MNEPRSSSGTSEGGERVAWWRSRWRLVVAVGAAIALVAVLVVTLAGRDGDETTTTQASSTSSPVTTGATTTTEATATTTTAAPTTQVNEPAGPSAADAVDGFLSAAVTMDEQLRAAAAAINGAGPPWESISEQLASTVDAAELAPVTEAIPAGLPHDLLQSVILVYSDLASRRAAMQSFAYTRPGPDIQGRDLLAELGNGHEAAERFDGDLAAARALATSLPPVTAAAPDSRAAAERLVLIDYVHKANAGCDSRGGAVIEELPTLTWETDTTGTIGYGEGSIPFEAVRGPDGRWTAGYIIAC